MTVTYSLNVANARLTGFSKLLLRWKGSIYKLLYREILIFCGLYYGLNLSYRYLLNEGQKTVFELMVTYCRAFTNLIPLSFVLGFYVSIVVTRWWQQYMQIPWPDKAVLLISGYIHGNDERGRIIRRTLARYLLLMQVLTCQAVSTSVRRRFPTLDHIEAVGLFTPEERIAYDQVIGTHGKWWVPAQWFTSLVKRARKEGRIKHDILMDRLIEELHAFRSCCGMMFAYDWISIPLVYTQTVTIATYTYFLCTLMSRQYLGEESKGNNSHEVDLYLPVFSILEFFFFMGWLKVAEQLINPYGEDDDDFELNWCLDRNLLISFMIVDDMHNKHPKLVRDLYWEDPEPSLPYTKSSVGLKLSSHKPHLGSTIHLNVQPEEQFLPMQTIMEDEHEEYCYTSPPNTADVATNPFSGFASTNLHRSNTNSFGVADTLANGGPLLNGYIPTETTAETEPIAPRTGSRGTLKKIQERGSRLLNMLGGSGSHENVSRMQSNSTVNLAGLDEPTNASTGVANTTSGRVAGGRLSQLSSFLLKTPRKRLRTSSMIDPPSASINREAGSQPSVRPPAHPAVPPVSSFNELQNMNTGRGSIAERNNSITINTVASTLPITSNNNINTTTATTYALPTPISIASPTTGLHPRLQHPKLHIPLRPGLDRRHSRGQYADCLPSAPILGANQRIGLSPIVSRLRNSFNYHIPPRYRNLSPTNGDFASAFNLRSAQQFPPADSIDQNSGFRFPSSYQAPMNPEAYLPNHLNEDATGSAATMASTDTNLNNVEITISPASGSANRSSAVDPASEQQSLISLNDHPISESAPGGSGPFSADIWKTRLVDVRSPPLSADAEPQTRVTIESEPSSRRSSETCESANRNANQFVTGSEPTGLNVQPRRSLSIYNDEDVYEKASSSSESLSAYESNQSSCQSTVRSYTELLKKEKNKDKQA